MKPTVERIMLFAALLTLALCMTCGAVFAADGKIQVGVKVQYGQTEARSMLDMINAFRTGNDAWAWNEDDQTKAKYTDLEEVTYDYNLEKAAMQRAAEIAIEFSHTRPNGEDCDSVNSEYDVSMLARGGENIAAGQPSAARAFEAWQETNNDYNGQGHRRLMLSKKSVAVGIGHVIYNGRHFWVQEFSDAASNAASVPASDDTSTVPVEVLQSRISGADVTTSPKELQVTCGNIVNLPTVSTRIKFDKTWQKVLVPVEVPYIWRLKDSQYASISDGKLMGNKVGTTELTANVVLDCDRAAAVPVEVMRLPQTIIAADSFRKNNGDEPFNLDASAKTEMIYSSSDESVVSVENDGTVHIHSIGTATITITALKTDDYEQATKEVAITVVRKKIPGLITEADKVGNPRVAQDGTTVWDYVVFGHYPQSTDGAGGFRKEPIRWKVLSVEDDKALLLSEKNLDLRAYNEKLVNVTWKNSTVRAWLNGNSEGDFLYEAFTAEEQKAIYQTDIQNPDNEEYGTAGGGGTSDKIFFLSLTEAVTPAYGFPEDYSNQSKARQAKDTDYVRYKGDWANSIVRRTQSDGWWLRSPGYGSYLAAYVRNDGSVYGHGDSVHLSRYIAVRPALYLNLNSKGWTFLEPDLYEEEADVVNVAGVTLDSIRKKLYVGDDCTLTANVLPSNATNKTVNWKSQNQSIATVTKQGTVKALSPGTTTVQVTTADGGFTAKCRITVTSPQNNSMQSVSVGGQTSSQSYKSKVEATTKIAKPKKMILKKAVSPKKGTLKLTWKRNKNAKGYQVVVATDRQFQKNRKTALVKNNKITAKTFKNLKNKKTYYVKVRAYKQVGNKKVYGAYSKVKKVRVR